MKDISIAEPISSSVVIRGSTRSGTPQVRLFFESGVDEGAYYPAQDVSVYGLKAVTELRDFCNKILDACKITE